MHCEIYIVWGGGVGLLGTLGLVPEAFQSLQACGEGFGQCQKGKRGKEQGGTRDTGIDQRCWEKAYQQSSENVFFDGHEMCERVGTSAAANLLDARDIIGTVGTSGIMKGTGHARKGNAETKADGRGATRAPANQR